MKRYLAVLALLTTVALIIISFAGCGLSSPQNLLAGKWQTSGGMISIEFLPGENKTSQGTFDAGFANNSLPDLVSGTYTVLPPDNENDNDRLSITYKLWSLSKTDTYTMVVSDDTLELRGEGIIGGLFGLSLVLDKQQAE